MMPRHGNRWLADPVQGTAYRGSNSIRHPGQVERNRTGYLTRDEALPLEDSYDDPKVIAAALGAIARSRNLSQIAGEAGMSREGLYKALSADGNPALATVLKVAHALGLRLHFEAIA